MSPSRDRASDTYERLRALIVEGRLAPGSRVVETDVAERPYRVIEDAGEPGGW